jgi:putative spermidine/putrescine transport system ATP-binding protein
VSDISLIGVTKNFGQETALKDFSLSVPQGQLVSLLGPSGCGKTTALRLIAGFLEPTAGEILVGGVDVTQIPAAKRGFGMVFQSYSLFPHLTAEENIQFGLKLKRAGRSSVVKRTQELLELTAMTEHGKKYPHQLSGGQQQRIALARALATEPKLLLLDEPLSALDAAVRDQLRTEIRNLQKISGVTTIFVTHDQQEALSISDQVAVMSNGRLEQLGTPEEIYTKPQSAFVAEFVGTTNRISTQKKNGELWSVLNHLVIGPKAGKSGTAYLRPEELSLVKGGGFTVISKTYQGSFTRVQVASSTESLQVDLNSSQAGKFAIGATVGVKINRNDPLIVTDASNTR